MIGPLIRSLKSNISVNKMLLAPSKFEKMTYSAKIKTEHEKWCKAPKSRGQNIVDVKKRISK